MRKIILLGGNLLFVGASGFSYPSVSARQLARLDRSAPPMIEQSSTSATSTLPKLLKELAKRYQVEFNYNHRQLSQKTVSTAILNNRGATIGSVLTELPGPLDLTFERFQGRTFLIYLKSSPAPISGVLNPQPNTNPSAATAQPVSKPVAKATKSVAEIRVAGRVLSETGGRHTRRDGTDKRRYAGHQYRRRRPLPTRGCQRTGGAGVQFRGLPDAGSHHQWPFRD